MSSAAGPIDCETCHGEVAIAGVDMHTPAWCLPDISPLWGLPTERGGDRMIPGIPGHRAYPRRPTRSVYSLRLIVVGSVDELGTSFPDPAVGLQQNWATLVHGVLKSTQTGDGTRTVQVTWPDGNTTSVSAHVTASAPTLRPGYQIRATLRLSVPSGDLVIV